MKNCDKNGFGAEYTADVRKTRIERLKLVPGVRIILSKFLLDGSSRLMSNNDLLIRHL